MSIFAFLGILCYLFINFSQCNEISIEDPPSLLAPINNIMYGAPNGYSVVLVRCAVPNCGSCQNDINVCTNCFEGYNMQDNKCIPADGSKVNITKVNPVATTIFSNSTIGLTILLNNSLHILLNNSAVLNNVVNLTIPLANNSKPCHKVVRVKFETNMTMHTCQTSNNAFKMVIQKTLKEKSLDVELNQINITCSAAHIQDLAEFGVSVVIVEVEISHIPSTKYSHAISSLNNAIALNNNGDCILLNYLKEFSPEVFLYPGSPIIASTDCHQAADQFCLPLEVSNAWCCRDDMSCIEGKCRETTVVTSGPTTAPTNPPARRYKQRKRSHCGSILTGTFDSYSAAVAVCDGNSQCFGIYDNQCDDVQPFYMCGGPETWDISPSSCVYQKVVPTTPIEAGEVCGGISCEEVILSFGVPCSTSWTDGCGHVPPPSGFTEKSIMYELCPVMCPGKIVTFSLELTGVMFDTVDTTNDNLKLVFQAMFLRRDVLVDLSQMHINTTIVPSSYGKLHLRVEIVHLTPEQESTVTSILKKTVQEDGGGMTKLLKEAAVDKFKNLQVKFIQHLSSKEMLTPKEKAKNVKHDSIQINHRPKKTLPNPLEVIDRKNRWLSLGQKKNNQNIGEIQGGDFVFADLTL